MHIRHIATTVLIAALALTGCSVDTSSSDTAKPKTVASKHSVAETAYLATARAKIPALEQVPDDQLLTLGHASCDAIDAGNSPTAVAATAENSLQIGAGNSGYLVGAAVSQFCPEHKGKL